MGEKPTAALVLSSVGGVFVLIGGLDYAALSPILPTYGIPEVFGLIGVGWAFLILVGGSLIYLRPEQHKRWGALVLAVSVLSVWGAFAGIFVGLLLGVIGGALGIAWRPRTATTSILVQQR